MDTPEIRYASARDGTRISYTLTRGRGTPLLYVSWPGGVPAAMAHEIAATRECADAAGAGRPLLRIDFRGLGFSESIEYQPTVEQQAMDIEAVCDALGEPVDLAAWCIACFPAASLAASRPELFRSLMLVAPDYEGCASHYNPLWQLRSTMPYAEWAELILRRGMDVPAAEAPAAARRSVEFAPEATAYAHIDACLEASLADTAHQLTIPTAVVATRASREQSAQVASAIPGCLYRSVGDMYVNAKFGELLGLTLAALSLPSDEAEHVARGFPIRPNPLSARETQVLRAMARGATTAEIAQQLVVSVRTVERHLQNIYNKTGAHNRVEAANWAREHGVG